MEPTHSSKSDINTTAELERQSAIAETTLYSIGDAVIATDERALVTRMNPVAERLTGWREGEAKGRPLTEVFHIVSEVTGNLADNPVERVLREGVVVGLANHTALIARDGATCPIADSGAPIRDASGNVLGAVLVFRDVTEERRHQQQTDFLAQASVLLATDLDFETTLRRIAELAVPRLADWCGVDMPQNGKLVSLAVTHVDPAKIALAWDLRRKYPPKMDDQWAAPNVLRTGKSEIYPDIPDEMLVASSPDEECLRLTRTLGLKSAIVVPLLSRGRALGALTLVSAESGRRYTADDLTLAEDLGRRAGLAIENSLLYREAKQAIQLRDDFMSVAGHELKTPLSAAILQIQLLARMLREGAEPSRLQERADRATHNLVRLGTLVNELLDVARITGGKLVLQVEEMELRSTAREVVMRHSEELARAGCTLTMEDGAPIAGRWDRVRIEQVLANLFVNALKYGKGKPIDVTLDAEGELARIEVKDRGIGIALDAQERVFERFERAVPSRQFGGLGLGLWIARQIVEAHGGKIMVDSRPGEGATFRVELPLGFERGG